jgi:hypothetical protein
MSGTTTCTPQPAGAFRRLFARSRRTSEAVASSQPAWLAVVYASTILVSAFLLFQVQPLVSKAILPWFGGSPAVWTTAMLFFQSLLFCGYAYAHLSEHYLAPGVRAVVHLGLIVLAVVLLPIAPDASWKPADSQDPTWRILGLLGVSVGLPYLVLSSTGPLVQAWFSRTYPGRTPYRLYALSNLGSLAALLSYPFVFEPAFALGVQTSMWSWGFGAFAVLCGLGAIGVWRCGREPGPPDGNETVGAWDGAEQRPSGHDEQAAAGTSLRSAPGTLSGSDGKPGAESNGQVDATGASLRSAPGTLAPSSLARPTFAHRGLWLLLPAFASLVLLATTQHVSHDVTPIPLLWVLPLSLYLLTFIICFDHPRWYRRGPMAVATMVLMLLVAGFAELPFDVGFVQELALHFAAMFGICMLCHGELVRLRPDPRYLTLFYLMISAGGALGGIFVCLIAPRVFDTYFEWKIGLVGSYLLAAVLIASELKGRLRAWLDPSRSREPREAWAATIPALTGVVCMAGLLPIYNWQLSGGRPTLAQTRNFFGEASVIERVPEDAPEERDLALISGSIVHGVQFVRVDKRHEPTTYYGRMAGAGRAIEFFRDRDDLRVGVVGLGVGTLAIYARPGQTYRFYEINPEIVRLAETHFTFLQDSPGKVEMVLGDARLSLEREPPQHYQVLVVDAFTGDAIPVHLLTREAVDIYLRHLADDGVLAFHVTNTYLDLIPVVYRLAEAHGLEVAHISTESDWDLAQYGADWMLLTRNAELLESLRPSAAADPPDRKSGPLWTDDYSSLYEILQ